MDGGRVEAFQTFGRSKKVSMTRGITCFRRARHPINCGSTVLTTIWQVQLRPWSLPVGRFSRPVRRWLRRARAAVALIVAHSVSKSSCPQDRASTALAPEIKDSTKTPSSATRRRVPCRSRHIVAASASAVAFPSESHPFAGAVWNTEIAAGSVAELERIVAHLRRRWPATRIGIRGDGGFCREAILAWCERHGVAYVLGLARNARLAAALEPALQEAAAEHRATGQPARRSATSGTAR